MDERSLISVTIDVFVVGNSLVMGCFVMDWSGMGSLVVDGGSFVVDRGSLMRGFLVDWSSLVWSLNNLGVVMDSLGIEVGGLSLVVGCDVMGILVDGLLVVDDLVVGGEVASVAIVVVHLEHKVAVLDVDLTAHEER